MSPEPAAKDAALAAKAKEVGAGSRRTEGHERAPLAPDEQQAKRDDPQVACQFDRLGGGGHRRCRGVEHDSGDADERRRHGTLEERREQGDDEAAPQRHLVGDHVGGDDGLAMAGPGGVEDAVGPKLRPMSPSAAPGPSVAARTARVSAR